MTVFNFLRNFLISFLTRCFCWFGNPKDPSGCGKLNYISAWENDVYKRNPTKTFAGDTKEIDLNKDRTQCYRHKLNF